MDGPRHLTGDEVKVGDIVGLWNTKKVDNVEVIEDLGNVGHRGRRMFRVRVPDSPGDEMLGFDAPLDSIVAPATPPQKPRRRSRKSATKLHPA